MQTISGSTVLPESLCGGAVSIGKFDGMHLGHSLIIQRLKSHAQRWKIPAIIISFDQSPAALLQPKTEWKPICTLERKIELIRNFHVDALVVLPITKELLHQSAETFFYETIQRQFHAKVLVEGNNFSFGKDRLGSPDFLRHFGMQSGINVDIVEPLRIGEKLISSSGIRHLIQNGQIEQANELMPMPYRMSGKVITGEQRGRTLGFPTANLGEVQTTLPKHGIYATATWIEGMRYSSTTHIGTNPTFEVAVPKIEVFVHDFEGDLYNKIIDVDFLALLREPERFDSAETLIRQMKEDVLHSRRIFDG